MNLKQSVSRLAVCSAVAVGLFVSVGTAAAAHAETDPNNQPAQVETAGTDSGMFGMHSGGDGYDTWGSYDGGAPTVDAGDLPSDLQAYFGSEGYISGDNQYGYTRTDRTDVTVGDLEQLQVYKANCSIDAYDRSIQCDN
ncbi:hypothetical protein [Subtercola endophyticus]|uniref:hypothetical protein n=1 Tax=Subtercola endophyticus TaxID=2895559 RepID=UPI001E38C240|nr:hypothetical protein [Subtercola endophyticus]UFS58580.1 hypothetical protein LQ955_16490 [Subtercola endophyticus]